VAVQKRTYAAVSAFLALALSGIVLWDVYVDWQLEGKALWSTLFENAVPLALGALIFVGGQWAYRDRDRLYVENVARWQVYGTVAIATIVGWVVALQTIQGELKPWLIVVQTTLGGAVAGTLIGIANARRDESMAAVETQRDRFGSLFGELPAEIADVDAEGDAVRIQQLNPGFAETFGVDPGYEGSLFEVVPHPEDERETLTDHVRRGEACETETAVTVDGEVRSFQVRVAPYGDGERAYLIYTDVTELVETQRELERTVGRLERSNERLEDFAYVASHNLQEPLRTVSSFAEILEADYGEELDGDAADHLETVVTGAHRMESMIDGLLQYAGATDDDPAYETVDTEELCEEVVTNLEALRKREDGSVTVESLPVIEADRDQLGQVFHHLLRNALEHSGSGSVEVTVRARETEDAHHFAVTDDGPGIDPGLQEDVFRMYESGETYERTAEEKGIGLPIADRIVSQHDGSIRVESEPEKGSTFQFTIAKT
jgi:PAS domain S-box-containing protein